MGVSPSKYKMENFSESGIPEPDPDTTLVYDDESALIDDSDDKTAELIGNEDKPKRKGSNCHCCWGQCRADTRYLEENSPILLIPFPKIGKFKPNMSKTAQQKQ